MKTILAFLFSFLLATSASARPSLMVSTNEGVALGSHAGLHEKGWTPQWITGLALYFDARVGLQQSGNVVSSWADQSPNSVVLSAKSTTNFCGYSATGGPNGTPTTTYAGSQSVGNASVSVGLTPFGNTAVIIAKQTGSQLSYFEYGHITLFSNSGVRDYRSTLGDVVGGTMSTSAFETWVATSVNGAQVFRVNGAQVATGVLSGSDSANTNQYFGASNSGAHPLTGAVSLLIEYNRAIDIGETARLEQWLRSQFATW